MEHITKYLLGVLKRRRKTDIAQGVVEMVAAPYGVCATVTSVRGDKLFLKTKTQHGRVMLEGFLREQLLTALRENGLMVSSIKVKVLKE